MNAIGANMFQAWLDAEAVAGPQRGYRLACRLADQMRPLGRTAEIRATWAVAHTLFWRGRLAEAQALLSAIRLEVICPESDAAFKHVDLELLIKAQLGWTLALQGDEQAARAQFEIVRAWTTPMSAPMNRAFACHALGMVNCYYDTPLPVLDWSRQARSAAAECGQTALACSASLLEYWALSHLGLAADEADAQGALSILRRLGPALEARAFSLYAQAMFHQMPALALTQLDAALDLNASCGLHHWEARLLRMKSHSLDAAGQLGEATRFYKLAQETAHRQGARLFLDDDTGIESRTHASLYLETAS